VVGIGLLLLLLLLKAGRVATLAGYLSVCIVDENEDVCDGRTGGRTGCSAGSLKTRPAWRGVRGGEAAGRDATAEERRQWPTNEGREENFNTTTKNGRRPTTT